MSDRELKIENVSILYPQHSKFGNRIFLLIFSTPFPPIFQKWWGARSWAATFLFAIPASLSHWSDQVASTWKGVQHPSLLATVFCFNFQLRSWDGSMTVRRAELLGRIMPQFLMTFSGNVFFDDLFLIFWVCSSFSYLIMITSVT